MVIIPLLTKQYAVCVYVYGTRKFETVVADYHEPVKKYAAANYTLEQIDNALVKGYITESEHIDTMKYVNQEESPAE
ncbi:hypothetical protein [Bacillus sp. AG4(2022)]|uniref:hypothetical protein n=1 Tax=Bacillus sp. AG4(2022) TaxID=2962594 RepID=UPI00288101B9|nr:hypothetical protein [Bacillus sp. AG4(2022)]MDT0160254.1 hypothetical protein [Bacillus sp. AG4(2022)]